MKLERKNIRPSLKNILVSNPPTVIVRRYTLRRKAFSLAAYRLQIVLLQTRDGRIY